MTLRVAEAEAVEDEDLEALDNEEMTVVVEEGTGVIDNDKTVLLEDVVDDEELVVELGMGDEVETEVVVVKVERTKETDELLWRIV